MKTNGKAKATKSTKTTDAGLVKIAIMQLATDVQEVALLDAELAVRLGYATFTDGTREKALKKLVERLKAAGLTGKLRIVGEGTTFIRAIRELRDAAIDAVNKSFKGRVQARMKTPAQPVVMPTLAEAKAVDEDAAKSLTAPVLLRSGFLVALRTSIRGGIEYSRVDLDAAKRCQELGEDSEGTVCMCCKIADHDKVDGDEEHIFSTDKAEVTRWTTTRTIIDAAEYVEAKAVRSKCNTLIRGACAQSDFGLVCPGGNEAKLNYAYYEARQLMAQFNLKAQHSRIEVNMLKGRLAADDELAVKGIGVEVRSLIEAMQNGIKAADPKAIRAAADRARKLGQMLDEGTQGKVSKAIEEARSAASVIRKRIEVGGEEAALVIQELSRKALTEARFAFLDLDVDDAIAPPSAPSVATAELDDDAESEAPAASSFAGRDLEVL